MKQQFASDNLKAALFQSSFRNLAGKILLQRRKGIPYFEMIKASSVSRCLETVLALPFKAFYFLPWLNAKHNYLFLSTPNNFRCLDQREYI